MAVVVPRSSRRRGSGPPRRRAGCRAPGGRAARRRRPSAPGGTPWRPARSARPRLVRPCPRNARPGRRRCRAAGASVGRTRASTAPGSARIWRAMVRASASAMRGTPRCLPKSRVLGAGPAADDTPGFSAAGVDAEAEAGHQRGRVPGVVPARTAPSPATMGRSGSWQVPRRGTGGVPGRGATAQATETMCRHVTQLSTVGPNPQHTAIFVKPGLRRVMAGTRTLNQRVQGSSPCAPTKTTRSAPNRTLG